MTAFSFKQLLCSCADWSATPAHGLPELAPHHGRCLLVGPPNRCGSALAAACILPCAQAVQCMHTMMQRRGFHGAAVCCQRSDGRSSYRPRQQRRWPTGACGPVLPAHVHYVCFAALMLLLGCRHCDHALCAASCSTSCCWPSGMSWRSGCMRWRQQPM